MSLSISMAGMFGDFGCLRARVSEKSFYRLCCLCSQKAATVCVVIRVVIHQVRDSNQPTPVFTAAFSPTSHGGPAASSQSKLAKLDSVLDRPPAIPRKTATAILLCTVAAGETDSAFV